MSVERNRFLQQHSGQTHAELVSQYDTPRPGHLRYVWKDVILHDEDNKPIERRRDRGPLVTILRYEGPFLVVDLGLDVARACGYKTRQGLRDAWANRHPRTLEANVVWFALGDWRDRDLFMNWSGRAGGDYTHNPKRAMDPDAPVLSREEIDRLSSINLQKDAERNARVARELASEPPSVRLTRLQHEVERHGQEAAAAIRQHLRVIEQRVKRAERRVKD